MGNTNPSTLLGNVQQKLVKQLKKSYFQSIFHNKNTIVNLSLILEMLTDVCLTCAIKVFSLNFGMDNLDSSTFLDNVQWKVVKQLKQ